MHRECKHVFCEQTVNAHILLCNACIVSELQPRTVVYYERSVSVSASSSVCVCVCRRNAATQDEEGAPRRETAKPTQQTGAGGEEHLPLAQRPGAATDPAADRDQAR